MKSRPVPAAAAWTSIVPTLVLTIRMRNSGDNISKPVIKTTKLTFRSKARVDSVAGCKRAAEDDTTADKKRFMAAEDKVKDIETKKFT